MAKTIEKRLMQGPKLPDVTSATFFKVKIFLIKTMSDQNKVIKNIKFPSIYIQEMISNGCIHKRIIFNNKRHFLRCACVKNKRKFSISGYSLIQ